MRMLIEGFKLIHRTTDKGDVVIKEPVGHLYTPERQNKERYPRTNYHRRRAKNWLKKHNGAEVFHVHWV